MATTITPVVSSSLCGAGDPPANFRRARLIRLKPDTKVFYPSTVFLCDLCEFLSVLCGLRFKALHRKVRKGCAKVARPATSITPSRNHNINPPVHRSSIRSAISGSRPILRISGRAQSLRREAIFLDQQTDRRGRPRGRQIPVG